MISLHRARGAETRLTRNEQRFGRLRMPVAGRVGSLYADPQDEARPHGEEAEGRLEP
jgi:hypothetical protein